MKKIIALILTLMMAFSFAAVFSGAEEVVHSSSEYDGYMSSHFDSILADDVALGEAAHAFDYMRSVDWTVEVKANVITIKGWIVCDREIDQVGYSVDNGAPVFKEEYEVEAEQAIYDVGAVNGAEYATRFIIPIDVSAMTGKKNIALVMKNSEGVYRINSVVDMEIAFDFIQEGTYTPEPEITPDPDEPVVIPEPIFVRFNDADVVDEFFMYAVGNNHVTDIGFDEDKECAVIYCLGGPDPNVILPFAQISGDNTLEFFDEEISTSKYKSLVLVGRFDYDTVFEDAEKDVGGTFYFTTSESPSLSESRNLEYYYERGDGLQYVILDFSKSKAWNGTVGDCRFDFFMTTDNDCEYEFYLLGFFAGTAEAQAFVDSYKENGDAVLPTPEPTPTPTATPEETPTPEVTEAPEATDAPTEAPSEAPAAPSDKPADTAKKGCGGFIAAMPVCFVLLASAVVLKKKNN